MTSRRHLRAELVALGVTLREVAEALAVPYSKVQRFSSGYRRGKPGEEETILATARALAERRRS